MDQQFAGSPDVLSSPGDALTLPAKGSLSDFTPLRTTSYPVRGTACNRCGTDDSGRESTGDGEAPERMAKEHFLHIRMSKKDKQRVESAAKTSYLEMSTWARMVILQAVERVEKERESPAASDG